MKKTILLSILFFAPLFANAQNPFITRWNLATAGSGATQLFFATATAGTVSYTWQSTTTATNGSGSFSGTSCTITGLPAGQTILLRIAPANFQRIIIGNGIDRSRLLAIEAWGDVAWTSMQFAFAGCNNLTTAAGNPILTGVTNMSSMFNACTNFNGNITGWNTATVTNMSTMFLNATAFNQPIGSWNTAAVTNMLRVFSNASSFNQPLSNWNTAAVTTMFGMFGGATVFNQPIGNWNTAAVTSMFAMFQRAAAFNQSISTLNTAAVTDMSFMFNNATAFNQNIGSWTLNANVNLEGTFDGAGLDCANYGATLNGWANNNPSVGGRTLGASGRTYADFNAPIRNILTNSRGWTITDAGACATTSYTTVWNLANPGSGGNNSIAFFTENNATISYIWETIPTGQLGSGTFPAGGFTERIIAGLPANATIRLRIAPANLQRMIMQDGSPDRQRLTLVENWGTAFWISMSQMFDGCNNMNVTATDLPNLSNCINMVRMFKGCSSLTGPPNINSWNTAAVSFMNNAFSGASAFNQPIGNWDTSRALNMSNMFLDATAFNQDISGWNTAKVADMTGMFRNAIAFNQPITSWDVSKVTNVSSMFQGATAFNQPLTWNVGLVTNMNSMFRNATAFNQAIGTWNTAAVTDMLGMFLNATAFNQPVGTWNTANVTDMNGMFQNAAAFNQSLGNWTLNANVNLSSMLNNAGLDCTNYSTTLAAWAVKPSLPTGRSLGATGRNFGTAAVAARTALTAPTAAGGKGWTIAGDVAATTACIVPEINVQGNNTNIADGNMTTTITNHTDFGNVLAGNTLVRTFTIQNTDLGALAITSITSSNPKFVIGTAPSSVLGTSVTTFTVTYTPTAGGTDNATITINNNDADEAVYDFAVRGTAQIPFTTRWNLATAGSGATQLTFGVATAGTVNYTWQSTTTSATGSGTFSGTTCTITGLPAGETILLNIAPANFQRFFMNYGIDRSRLMAIEAWGTVAWTNMEWAFHGCNNLTTATGIPILTGVPTMQGMFSYCRNFNDDISGWNAATITNMRFMFQYCLNFNSNILGWNTAAVTDMSSMFFNAVAFNQPIGSWNTSAVTNMYRMFFGAVSFNQPIGNWNTAAVTNMSEMFLYNSGFNQPIDNWNTSAVTNMSNMFTDATAFNQNLGSWTLNANVNLVGMLDNSGMDCSNYSATLLAWAAKPGLPTGRTLGAAGRNFGTDAVAARTLLTTPVASGGKGWTISDDVASAFGCLAPEINVQGNNANIADGSITPSAINNTDFGVVNSTSARTFTIQNTGIGALTISSIASSSSKFVISNAPTSIAAGASATFTVTYTSTATGTDNATITINNNDSDEAVYDFAIVGRAINPFITRWNLATAGSAPTQLSFEVATSGTVNYTWQSTTTSAAGSGTFSGTTCTISGLPAGQTILLRIASTNFERFIMNNGSDASRLTAIESWGDVPWTSMNSAFYGCNNLISATGNPILTGVTDMSLMFSLCSNFNSNISGWNTATVTNMSSLFLGANSFNQPIGVWNTAAVTDMSSMFENSTSFNQPIGTWNTASVINMRRMFINAANFNQPIGTWNTSAVTNMGTMFFNATAFNEPIGTWNTAAVTNMFGMFFGATAFNQPIGMWNTAAVTDMSFMFFNATAFDQAIGTWTLKTNVNINGMLNNSGINCSNYDATLVGWSNNPLTPANRNLGSSGRVYSSTAGQNARTRLTSSAADGGRGWVILQDTLDVACAPFTNIDNLTTITACGSYTWPDTGQTYTASSTYTGQITNAVTNKLVLTIFTASNNVTTISNCGSYTWANNNQTYTQSGVYTGTTTNCVTQKLNLTITNTNPPTAASNQTFCANEPLSNIAINGTGVIWNNAATAGTILPASTVIQNSTTYYAAQTVNGCESITRQPITMTNGACLSNENFDEASFSYYSNPTTGKVFFSYAQPIEKISVSNILGQVILENKNNTNEAEIDLSGFAGGTYLFKIISNNQVKIIKVVKN